MGLSGFAVSPHTGARLETTEMAGESRIPMMPPTRGHDLKQLVRGPMRVPGGYAPTPGNVLKYFAPHLANTPGDAPTVSLLSVLLSSLFSLTLFYSKQFLALKPMLLLMQIILLIFSL